MDKNSISDIDENQENGAGSVGENWLNTTVKNNKMTSESQDFRPVDVGDSQSTQIDTDTQQHQNVQSSSSSTLISKKNDAQDKPDEAQDATMKVVQDGGGVENENKIKIEAEKNDDKETTLTAADMDDDVVYSTPPDEIFSPSKRQLLGAIGPHKRKTDDSTEPIAKIARCLDDDIIAETQESLEEDDNVQSEVINVSVKSEIHMENVKKISDANENTVKKVDDTDLILKDVNQESFQILSQALVSGINDGEKMEMNNSVVTTEKTSVDVDIVGKPEMDIKQTDESTIISVNPLDKTSDSQNDDNSKSSSNDDAKKSRMSIEVIYDKSLAPLPKPKELVEIDEDGEKIVLDLSHETLNDSDVTSEQKKLIIESNRISDDSNTTNDTKLTNGNEHSNVKSDSDHTENVSTDMATDSDRSIDSHTGIPTTVQKMPELLTLISDSEEDSFMAEEKTKIKTVHIEKEIAVLIKVKCLLHVDEVSKDINNKEVTFVSCENATDFQSSRRRTSSALGLADISDTKDSVSPSSVTSISRPYTLNPRLSMMSVASSSSSSSSESFKLPTKDAAQFSLPRGVPKHAKKASEPHSYDEIIAEKLKKEWKNVNLLTTTLLNFLNSELMTADLHNGTVETTNNTSEHFRSSTPEASQENATTPKSSGKMRLKKQTRSQNHRNSSSNGLTKKLKGTLEVIEDIPEVTEKKDDNDSTNESLISAASTPSRQSIRSMSILRNQTPSYDQSDALIGKHCFAKWGDNNYYPAIVVSKSKTKFRINFLDGLNKLLIEEFVIAMPPVLPIGLSIYAAVKDEMYGSSGVIVDIDKSNDTILYIVETDEGEKLKVRLHDIFLTTDQVAVLRELMKDNMKTPPSTPHLAKISSDNIIEGKRGNESPVITTPKSTRGKSRGNTEKKIEARPSGSGVSSKINFKQNSDTDLKTSDSNTSGAEDDTLGAIQVEIIGTSSEYTAKGPQSRLKGKARSKKKVDDQETIALLGPIPEEGSTLFKGINFILTCAPLESLDKYKIDNKVDSNSESGTDLEQDWNSIPFVRDRLSAQITLGGGKLYEKFEDIPKNEYEITKLITNVPNITAKSLQCLSVGIHSWNHKWVIRSCLDNKLVNVNQEKLPAGWSLDRKSYVEMCERPTNKPFNHIIIAVPKITGVEESTKFWKQIIENAGGVVRLIEDPSDNFIEATAVLTNRQCPNWIEQRAQAESIPLVSTTWIVQCLVAGVITSHETQIAYFHHYMK